MSDIFEELRNLFYQARKTIFGLDPPITADLSNTIDTELTKYVYPEQLKPHSRSACEQKLQKLTQSRFWQWNDFREILVNLVCIRERNYLPAVNIPKLIYIDGLLPIIRELVSLSSAHHGVEVSRSVFVDRERYCLIQSGRTKIGSGTTVMADFSPEAGREYLQTPIISIHIHPLLPESYLFSFMDYISFLSEPRLIVMVVSNRNDVLLALKTTATSDMADFEGVKKHITMTNNDIENIWKRLGLGKRELAVNKAICTEFGLTLFKVIRSRNNIAKHIIVVES